MNEPPSDGRFASNEVVEIREERRYRLALFTMGLGALILLGFGFADFVHSRLLEAFSNFFVSLFITVSLLVLRRRRSKAVLLFCTRLILFFMGLFWIYFALFTDQQEAKILWCYLYPAIAYFMFGKREGTVWMLAFYVLILGSLLVPFNFVDLGRYSAGFKLRLLVSLAFLGAMFYFFERVRDETQHLLEDHHQQLLDSEKRYRTAYETLKETQSQLIQSGKLAALGGLAAGVAHELNQPLMVARTNAQLALRGLDKQALSPEELRERIQPIEKSTKRMMNIINHLRTFSRQSQKEFSPVDVNSVLKDCFLMMGEQLRLHNVDVKLEFAERLPKVMGNANHLEQVFLNVIANAKDAVLEARTEEKAMGVIEVVTGVFGKEREWVEVLVRDTGGGITGKDLNRIFEPFFTTKEVGKGTGLGMSISHGIMKEHCGAIEVPETGPGGTVFRVCLPVRSPKRLSGQG